MQKNNLCTAVTFQPQTQCEVCGRGYLDLFWVVVEAMQATWKAVFLLFYYVCASGIAIKMKFYFAVNC